MKVVVVGPGALGCLFAALLQEQADCDLWLLDHNRARAEFLNAVGLQVEEESGDRMVHVHVAALDGENIGQADCILLCVKSHAVAQVLLEINTFARHNSLIVTLQNGISHLDVLRSRSTPVAWATGITAQGATLLAPGRIRHAGNGPTRIGFLEDPEPGAQRCLQDFVALLNAAGIATFLEADILSHIWTKLLVNAGINALTAIHGCPNGELVRREDLRATMIAAVKEAAAVAAAMGISIAGDPVERVIEVARATATNISSMLQDARHGRKTEVEAINGEVVRAARLVGIGVPVNEQLMRQILDLPCSASTGKGTFP